MAFKLPVVTVEEFAVILSALDHHQSYYEKAERNLSERESLNPEQQQLLRRTLKAIREINEVRAKVKVMSEVII